MSHQTVVLDVREDLKEGAGSCSKIMEVASYLQEGDSLRLIAPFEPKPLYDVLGREGFSYESRRSNAGDWEVQFTWNAQAVPSREAEPSEGRAPDLCGCEDASGEWREIDVRGLEPPQPMVRILDALATLPEGAKLRAFTDRQPLLLSDQLQARGFDGETNENPEGGFITIIRSC